MSPYLIRVYASHFVSPTPTPPPVSEVGRIWADSVWMASGNEENECVMGLSEQGGRCVFISKLVIEMVIG